MNLTRNQLREVLSLTNRLLEKATTEQTRFILLKRIIETDCSKLELTEQTKNELLKKIIKADSSELDYMYNIFQEYED